ncbi:hypothetical protein R1flu_015377 [Riccia fluitans]|uniref:DEAD-box helicase OB fold domain-containing protein n=1 Tax=Riccia fluitans TaxID=41844 RepID=A0ABD1YIR8_9MARC
MLKSLGINDLINFDFMDPPPAETLLRALEQLYALGALNDRGSCGQCAHEFSLWQCWRSPALLKVYDSWKETDFSTQWCYENYIQVRSMKLHTSNPGDHEGIKKAVTSGFFYHTAKLQKNGTYRTLKNPQSVTIHPSSGLSQVLPRWVLYHELVFTTKEYMRQVIEIKPEWLVEIAPHYYKRSDVEDSGCQPPRKKCRKEGAEQQRIKLLIPLGFCALQIYDYLNRMEEAGLTILTHGDRGLPLHSFRIFQRENSLKMAGCYLLFSTYSSLNLKARIIRDTSGEFTKCSH